MFFSILIGVAIPVIFLTGGAMGQTIEILYFFSEECDHCSHVDEFVLGPLQGAYPVHVERINIDDDEGYGRLLQKEEAYGEQGNEIPVIFIGEKVLGGAEEIEAGLEAAIQEIMNNKEKAAAADAAASRKREWLTDNVEQPAASVQEAPVSPVVYVAYFTQAGCKECDRAYRDIRYIKSRYPQIVLREFDIADTDSKALNEALGEICGVPEKKRLVAPSVYIGTDFLVQEEISAKAIDALVLKYIETPAPPPWEAAKGLKEEARKGIISRFQGLSISTIVAAGLLDGINPCAFATIIFFISYLAYIGRKGKDILLVGGAFTFAVFITYMLIGLGFFSFISSLSFLPLLSKIVYLATAAFALVLGILSLKDFIVCRAGNLQSMSLQLPNFLKKRIHSTIRKEAKLKRYVLGALTAGFIISLLELACTGQVYLPTIIFVTRMSDMKARAILYLLLYNTMFITPLVIIFVTVYKGASSQELTAVLQRSAAGIKLGMSLFFFALAAILIFSMV
ncbi:hypothetical protein JXL19_08980 [bacterium]|nr:hypothetical protein [bacterium]